MKRVRYIFIILIGLLLVFKTHSQIFYLPGLPEFRKVELNNDNCGCSIEFIAQDNGGSGGISFSPEGNLYEISGFDGVIFEIDTFTGANSLIFSPPPPLPFMTGLVAVGNGIFYTSTMDIENSDIIYRWDINAGTVLPIGATGYNAWGEMLMFGGEIYYLANNVEPAMFTI